MVELQELFEVKYGVNLELNKLDKIPNGITFVSRTEKNNGVSAKVKRIESVEPLPSGVITVAGGGSVMEAFLQPEPFYSGRDLYYLMPKEPLTDNQKLFYCMCIRANKYRYSYGRQANRTLRYLKVPSLDEIPKWIDDIDLVAFDNAKERKLDREISLPQIKKTDIIENIFNVENGIVSTGLIESSNRFENCVMYIRPASTHFRTKRSFINRDSIDNQFIFPKNSLFVSTNGEGSHTYSYISTEEFVPNSDVSVLIPKEPMPVELLMFYSRCITANRYLFSYGRKPKGHKLKKIKLPIFSETEIKTVIEFMHSLQFSKIAFA